MLALIFFIAFPFLLFGALKNLQTAKASVNWPTTPGTITKVERFKRLFRSMPRVGFTYSVDGKSFQSERISFATGYRPKDVEAILSRYAVGQTVAVSYPPEKPAEGVLEPGVNPQVTSNIKVLVVLFFVLLILNVVRFFLPR